LATKFTNHVTRPDIRTIWQFILYLMVARKFHIEILDSSMWMIYWKWWCKSVVTNITQQMLVCLGPWQWCNQNVTCELRVVGRWTFLVKYGGQMMCVCVTRLCFWHYHPKARFQKLWGWNFLCKRWARNRNVSKINWKL
jgi:hypothetical protein